MNKIRLFLLTVFLLSSIQYASAQDMITLHIWGHIETSFNEGLEDIVAAYSEANPNISFELTFFEYDDYIENLTAVTNGEEVMASDEDNADALVPPDIVALFGSWACNYSSMLAPAAEDIAANSDIFFTAPIDGFFCDDGLVGLPQEFNLEYSGVLVNREMFEIVGLDYPPNWETMDDLISDAQNLVRLGDEDNMEVAGYHFTSADAIVFSFLSGILQRDGDYWNEDETAFVFDTPEARATLEEMMALVEAGIVDPILFNDDENWSGYAFFTDVVAIASIGPWSVYYGLSDFPEFGEFDYVPLPNFTGSTPFVAESGWGFGVVSASEQIDIGWDFVNFATSNSDVALQWNLQTGTIPALQELVASDEYLMELQENTPWLEFAIPRLEYGEYIGDIPERDMFFYDIVYPIIIEYLQGFFPLDEAITFLEEDANALLE